MKTSSSPLLLLVLAALYPAGCGPAPHVASAPAPVAVAMRVDAAAPCPALSDPQGWFALGTTETPTVSAIAAHRVLFAIDDSGVPWLAAENNSHVRVGRAGDGEPKLDDVPGMEHVTAFGLRGSEPVLASISRDVHGQDSVLVADRYKGGWRSRKAPPLCPPIAFVASGGAAFATPDIAVDRAGDVWQGCIEGIRGPFVPRPSGPGFPEDWWDDHPVVSTRLHIGRLDGEHWAQLPVKTTSKTNRSVTQVIGDAGLLEVHVDWPARGGPSKAAFLVDPVKRAFAATAATQNTISPELMIGSVVIRDGIMAGIVRTDACFEQGGAASGACVMTLGVSNANGPWRPMIGPGSWADGISKDGSVGQPAIALDSCSVPVIAWNDGAGHMLLRRWNGHDFVGLPSVAGHGPHGLAVDVHGDVFVGTWSRDREPGLPIFRDLWTLTKIHDGRLEPLPVLTPSQPGEWSSLIAGRTHLDVQDGIRVSFPRAQILGEGARMAFQLVDNQWRAGSHSLAANVPALPFSSTASSENARAAEYSSLAFDRQGRPVIVWAEIDRIHVARFDNDRWTLIDDAALPRTFSIGAPTLAAEKERICVAWTSVGMPPSVFVRCHKSVP